MKVGICDDSDADRKRVLDWISENHSSESIDIYEFPSGESLLEFLARNTLDLLFLDGQMPNGMNGIKTAQVIRQSNKSLIIIILSSYKDYAFYGYDYDIFKYILKQEFEKRIADIWQQSMRKVKHTASGSITIKTPDGLVSLSLPDVVFFESSARKMYVYLFNDDVHEFYGQISELEESLRKR